MARYMRSYGKSFLRPPAVVAQVSEEWFDGPRVRLTNPQDRNQVRYATTYRLTPPAVVGEPVVFIAEPVRVTLTYSLRGTPKSHLGPGQVDVFTGPQVTLAPNPRQGYQTHSALSPPAHVQVEPNRPLQLRLTRITPPPTVARLQPPAVVAQPVVEAYYGPAVTLAASATQARKAHPQLRAPAVVGAGRVYAGLALLLARSSRGLAKSRLQPPAVLAAEAVEVFYGPSVWLSQARRGAPKSRLYPPIIPPLAEATRVTLAYSSRGQAKPFLSPPAHVQVEPNRPVQVQLTRILPPPTQAVLEPPVVIGLPPFRGLLTHLAYSRRGAPKSRLTGLPTGASDVHTGPRTHLAYSVRGKAQSQLLPVKAGVEPFRPVTVTLAANKVKPTTAVLQPPAVVQAQTVVFYGPAVNLTYSRRGEPLSELRPPAVVGAGRVFRPILVTLVTDAQRIRWERYLQRAPFYRLGPPIVVRTAQVLFGPLVELAPSRFPKPKSRLRPPAVVGQRPFRPVEITLARNKPRPTTTLLRPPAVTRQPPFRGVQVNLTYSRRGAPVWFLRPPAVVLIPPHRGVLVHLTYSVRGAPTSFLKPPSVVGAGVAFYGPQLNLTYSVRGKPIYELKPPSVTEFFHPGGDVCGFDVAASFVCVDETSDAGHKITGTDGPTGRVTGGDRKAT